MEKSKLMEMHNVGIVVEPLDSAIEFFIVIGLTLEGRMIMYRLCYIRGTKGLLIGLAERLDRGTATDILKKQRLKSEEKRLGYLTSARINTETVTISVACQNHQTMG